MLYYKGKVNRMEELITCSREEFKQKVERLSSEEMQEVIWVLEGSVKQIGEFIQKKGKINENDEKGKDEGIQAINLKNELQQKVRVCREIMMKTKYNAVLAISRNVNAQKFSWGIKENEPQVIFTGNNLGNTITVTNHGEFRWIEQRDLNIDQMPDQRDGVNFTVPLTRAEKGKKVVNASDIMSKVNDIQAKTGKLKLFKVTIEGQENMEYFMLLSIKDLHSIDREQLKQHFIETYLTEAHKKMVIDSLENEKCLYGGSISKAKNGKLETEFYNIYAEAVAKANVSMGTCKTNSGKVKFGTMQGLLDGISGSLVRRKTIKILNKKINEPENSDSER